MKNEEIDQKQLKRIRQRFIDLSDIRFKRMESSLSPTQADYLKLLPLLFHVNHPMLPGFVDKFTPCGLPNYTPSKLEKDIAKTVSQSFVYKPRAHLSYPIASLFLMGSMGTLGQSNSSDIDLWICLSKPLENNLLAKLNNKADKIKRWLFPMGIELNFYLVNLDDFTSNKNQTIDTDNCGNTQRFLLLDEFYRTAVWFAGRWPIWWLVPSNKNYSEYSKRLTDQKHVDPADWIDFGEAASIPAAEYFSAALWQLYKAIESPYKSSVKLLVLEVYAKKFPCAGILSNEFKTKVHQSDCLNESLDPYWLMLKFAEDALTNNPQRLEFLRRAFYLKANVKVILTKTKKNWRYKMIYRLVKDWNWNQARLNYLNSRHQWGITEVMDERLDLVRELTNSYHFLSSFARVQGVIDKVAKNELLSLSRKLYAAFERRHGKIDQLNTGIAKDTYESAITLSQKNEQSWNLLIGHINQKQLAISPVAHSAHSLFECLVWGCINSVVKTTTRIQVYSVFNYLNHGFAAEIVRNIYKLLKQFKQCEINNQFEQEAKITCMGLFVNSRFDPLEEDKLDDLYRVTELSDCFSWTENKINLVSHFDVMLVNSWGEISTQHFSGVSAWIDFFIQHEKLLCRKNTEIPIFCHGLVQKEQIADRVAALLNKWKLLKLNSIRTGYLQRYLILVGKHYLTVQISKDSTSYEKHSSRTKLFSRLSQEPNENNPEVKIRYHLDPSFIIDPFMEAVLKRRLSDGIEFIVHQKTPTQVEVAVKSITGSIHYQIHKNTKIEQVVGHYRQFFEKVQNRNLLQNGLLESISYHQFVLVVGKNVSKIKPLNGPELNSYQQFSLVQAIATDKHISTVGFDLFTAETRYLYVELGELVYQNLAQDLLKKRENKANYPIFLTDLDISATQNKITIIEALTFKKQIEFKLNRVNHKT